MREAGKNRVRGSNQGRCLPVLPFSLACRCAMIRAVKWMDEVEEEKRQKVVHEEKDGQRAAPRRESPLGGTDAGG